MNKNIKKIVLISLLAIIPFLGLALFTIAKIAHPYFKSVFESYDDLNTVVQENVRGIRVVKSYFRIKDSQTNQLKAGRLIRSLFSVFFFFIHTNHTSI